MESKNYLISKLQTFANQFEDVQLSYFYDSSYSQHVIAIAPTGKYSEREFAEAQVQFELDFIKHFPYESLYFVEKTEIETPELFDFECESETQLLDVFNLVSSDLFESLFSEINNCSTFNWELSGYSEITSEKLIENNVSEILTQPNKTISFGEENSYAMAA